MMFWSKVRPQGPEQARSLSICSMFRIVGDLSPVWHFYLCWAARAPEPPILVVNCHFESEGYKVLFTDETISLVPATGSTAKDVEMQYRVTDYEGTETSRAPSVWHSAHRAAGASWRREVEPVWTFTLPAGRMLVEVCARSTSTGLMSTPEAAARLHVRGSWKLSSRL